MKSSLPEADRHDPKRNIENNYSSPAGRCEDSPESSLSAGQEGPEKAICLLSERSDHLNPNYNQMKIGTLSLGMFLVSIISSFAQTKSENHFKHQVQLILSHTQIHSALDQGGNPKWQSLPSWGLNYNYRLAEKWKIGLHSDIIVEDFQVKSLGRSGAPEVLDRRFPIASAVVISKKLSDHFQLLLGLGGEFAKSQSFFLMRGGVEYGYHFHKNWELIANITNDFKWDAYNSWALGLGVTRNF